MPYDDRVYHALSSAVFSKGFNPTGLNNRESEKEM
jgi:hypothetical protein